MTEVLDRFGRPVDARPLEGKAQERAVLDRADRTLLLIELQGKLGAEKPRDAGFDAFAGVIKSGGKTRRAAKMNTLRDWHGDIEEFIDCKQKEEKKAWALIEQGYDGSFNGDAYGSVMYQNENLSVRVSDEFMEAALEGKEWWTKSSTTGQPLQKKDANTLLNKIAEGTHICGDPGLQYDGAIQKWHTCKGTEPIHSTNPCSEYVFLNNTACNLASLNLMKFKREDGTFDVERSFWPWAQTIARRRNHPEILPEHLLSALLAQKDGLVVRSCGNLVIIDQPNSRRKIFTDKNIIEAACRFLGLVMQAHAHGMR